MRRFILHTAHVRNQPLSLRVPGPRDKFPHFSAKIWKLLILKTIKFLSCIMLYNVNSIFSTKTIRLVFEFVHPTFCRVLYSVLDNDKCRFELRWHFSIINLFVRASPANVCENVVETVLVNVVNRVQQCYWWPEKCRSKSTSHTNKA
ncbi:hypothetical protein ATCV1_z694R [Acanthocystis turfacea chlorella virus 1]|uniref:Uncharacterized protein z694R n=1 Tax=Chlorovirus heliozoae TaxID=322019 RepID=A7K9V4_9PHYC|nr:hypothetical protein ATCV1_z694R [Acanthocystis turfacea chlorella virus 1]ABT16828.1 hypothetical protein ATCV1_z694R [Acanthocystis turfacea chlorella virus 1]